MPSAAPNTSIMVLSGIPAQHIKRPVRNKHMTDTSALFCHYPVYVFRFPRLVFALPPLLFSCGDRGRNCFRAGAPQTRSCRKQMRAGEH